MFKITEQYDSIAVYDPNGDATYNYQTAYDSDGIDYVWAPVAVIHYDATQGQIGELNTATADSEALYNADDGSLVGYVAEAGSGIDASDYTINGTNLALTGRELPTAVRDGFIFDGWYYVEAEDAELAAQYASERNWSALYGLFAGEFSTETMIKEADSEVTVCAKWVKEPIDWDTSKSKTATQLDENYESRVTLSLPASEEKLVTDVVLVLDKSTSTDVEDEALAMLQGLQEQMEETDAKIKVAVVIFNRQANVSGFYDLATQYSEIEAAVKQTISSGTNTHAGLLAAQKLLDEDTQVDANRKYMIFVSDGITYMFDEEANAINSQQATTGEYAVMAGNDCWGIRHYLEGGDAYVPADWDAYLKDVGEHLSDVEQYIQPYSNMNAENHIPRGNTELPTTVDVALYKSAQVFEEMMEVGYKCYAVTADTGYGADYPWGPAYMSYLQTVSKNGEVSFADIQNDIYYLLDAGSKVVDVIGSGTDDKGNAYDFVFVNNAESLKLTVGGKDLTTTDLSVDLGFQDPNETARYGFGEYSDAYPGGYAFVLHYYANGQDGQSEECFVWDINTAVSNFAPVQLTYSVRLTNPQTEEGVYGRYDEDGSEGYAGLYTNNSAVLYPVDSDGNEGLPDEFAKPTVSYTVKGEEPTEPSTEEPTKPTEPETTAPTQPSKPSNPNPPQPQNPSAGSDTATGDTAPVGMLFAAALAAAAAIVLVVLKKKGVLDRQ